MHLAHSNLKPAYWCSYCEAPLLADEVIERDESVPTEFWGMREVVHQVVPECAACGNEVEDYNFQDERDEEDA